jgi:hypothetical protein
MMPVVYYLYRVVERDIKRKDRMNKIQFDTVNGVQTVKEFEDGVFIVDEGDVFEALESATDSTIYGSEISDATFDKISAEYGIH